MGGICNGTQYRYSCFELMMRTAIIALLLAFVVACSMTAEQELELNRSLKELVEARNSGDALSYLNATHPAIVKYYDDLGEDAMQDRFQEVPKPSGNRTNRRDSTSIVWGSYYIKSSKTSDSLLQVKVEIQLIQDNERMDSSLIMYATTPRSKSNWLFVTESDYHLAVYPDFLKLFETK